MKQRRADRTGFKRYIFLLLFAVLIFSEKNAHPSSENEKTPIRRIIVEAAGGYSRLNSYYEKKLDPSPAFILKTTTDIVAPFYIQGLFSYSSYGFKESSGSYIGSYSLYLGPVVRYSLYGSLLLTGGLYLSESIFTIKASHLMYTDRTYKTGFAASGGVSYSFTREIIGEAGVLISQSQLSGETFRTVNVYAGAGYSFNFYPPAFEKKYRETRKALTELEQLEGLYNSGVLSYNEGNIDEAEDYFKKVVDLKENYRDTGEYIKTIGEIKRDMETADKLSSEEKQVQAIPLLSKWEKQVPAAREKLEKLRKDLAAEAEELEARGIREFDRKNYRGSIRLLSRVLLIDPKNTKARLYLNRARRYLNTIEKFR